MKPSGEQVKTFLYLNNIFFSETKQQEINILEAAAPRAGAAQKITAAPTLRQHAMNYGRGCHLPKWGSIGLGTLPRIDLLCMKNAGT